MKVYVHYEPQGTEEGSLDHTLVLQLSDEEDPTTVLLLKQRFVQAYNKKHGHAKTLLPDNVDVVTEEKRSRPLRDQARVATLLSDKADVFIVERTANVSSSSSSSSASPTATLPSLTMRPTNLQQMQPEVSTAEAAAASREAARQFMKAQNYPSALQKYTEAIHFDSGNANYHCDRSKAFLKANMFHEAIEDAEQALKLNSSLPEAYFRKACAYAMLEDYESASQLFQQAASFPELDETTKKKYEKKMTESQKRQADKQQGVQANASKNTSSISDDSETKPLDEATANNPQVVQYIMAYLAEAEKARHQSNFKYAVAIYEKVLGLLPKQSICLYQLGNIWLSAGKVDKAITYLKQGVAAHPTSVEFHQKLGEAYFARDDYKLALQSFSNALTLALSAASSSAASSSASVADANKQQQDGLKVWISKCLFANGQQQSAAQILMEMLKENEDNDAALTEYGKVLVAAGKPVDALHVFLRVLVHLPNDKTVRAELGKLAKKEGAEMLLLEVGQVKSATAFAFLASIIKEHGAVEESVELYKAAHDLEPSSPTFALNLVHVLEVCNRYDDAYLLIKDFLRRNKDLTLVSDDSHQLSCEQVLNVLEGVDSITDYFDQQKKKGKQEKEKEGKAEQQKKEEKGKEKESEANSIRGDREFHKTTIRNEHAYYGCVSQLLAYRSTLSLPDYKPFYVAGDSHCLAPAWHTINFNGQPRLLQPMLVTGMKMWHLRPDSVFFPKYNFFNVVSTIPPKSDVLFLFGEIDCREGLVVSVDKCRYQSIEEGADVTIQVFINVLKDLRKRYQWNIYIHPVVPVLNETRHIVKTYNKVLRKKVEATTGLHWLDFFDQLLDDSSTGFNKRYELDGTHLNSTYVPLIEAALNSLSSSSNHSKT
ncbi:Tetratricopeptide repeat [Balamuthia mandrillaris]